MSSNSNKKTKTKTNVSRSKNDIVKEGEHEKVMKGFIDLEETSLAKDELTFSGDDIMSAVQAKAQNLHTDAQEIEDPENKKLLESTSQPMFWVRGDSTKALCDELASSEANGWGKMHCCAKIASLVLDTIALCGEKFNCVEKLRESSLQNKSTAKNGAPREVAIFIKKFDNHRVGIVPKGYSMSQIYPKETHGEFMNALDEVKFPYKNSGTWKTGFTYRRVIRYLTTQHNILTWQFGEEIMAPSGWDPARLGNHVLREYRALIPPMMKHCGSNNLEKGVTNFGGKRNTAWHNLNTCLAQFRHSQEEKQQNERKTVIVLGLMEDKYPDEDEDLDCEIEENNDDEGVPLAVTKGKYKYKLNNSFMHQTRMFRGTLTSHNAVRMHCLVEAHNQNQNPNSLSKKTVSKMNQKTNQKLPLMSYQS